jgi:SM-20-related protein
MTLPPSQSHKARSATATLLGDAIASATPRIADELANRGIAIVTDAIPVPTLQALRDDLQAAALRPASIGPAHAAQRHEAVRRDAIAWMDGSTTAQQAWLNAMESLRRTLNRELFLGLHDYECHYACYEPGQFYRRHCDAFADGRVAQSRVLSTVCYLNEQWRCEDAGELLVYDDDDHLLHSIAPLGGTLVVFLSERFPHEVVATTTQRMSIAGWFRRR